MSRCLYASDCPYFFQNCTTDHWDNSPCPGHCVLATWFVMLLLGTCLGTICALVICLRCEFCPLSRLLCVRRTPEQELARYKEQQQQGSYKRQTSGMTHFHQVVTRSMSTEPNTIVV